MNASPIDIGPFTEGVNLVDPPSMLSPKELQQCRNWRLGDRGNPYKRLGHTWYGTAPAKVNGGNAIVNLLLRFYKSDGTKLTIAAAGKKLFKGTDATGAWTAININGTDADMAETTLCDWMVFKNRVYITDGIHVIRYNLTDAIYAGHYVHAAPTLAKTSGGSLTAGTYKFFVTSVAGDMGEGPKGAEASITLTTETKINISAMAAAPSKHEELTKRIYMTKKDGTLFYLLGEIPSATTTYPDVVNEPTGDEFVASQVPPTAARFVIKGHDERTYWFGFSGTDASLVYVSEVGFPDQILSATGFFSVSNNDGDVLTGGSLVPGGIVFFKKTSMWLQRAFGYGLINVSPREKRGSGVGCTAPFSAVSTPIGLIFLSQQGEIYLFDGTNLKEIGRNVSPEFRNMTEAAMNRVVACYHDYRYIISYDFEGSHGYNYKTLEYNTRTGIWEGPHENADYYTPSYYSVWDSVLDRGELYWGEAKASNGSYIYGRTKTSYTDRGSKFVSSGKTGALPLANLGDVNSYKVILQGDYSGDASFRVSHINEAGVKTSVNLNIPIQSVGSILGTGLIGAFVLSGTFSQVLEGSLEPSARSKMPVYEFGDGGTALIAKINIIKVLARGLPL